jgi:hypothetical protein
LKKDYQKENYGAEFTEEQLESFRTEVHANKLDMKSTRDLWCAYIGQNKRQKGIQEKIDKLIEKVHS